MIKTNLGKISITNKGEYSAATTYETLDVVSFNGSSYMAKQQTVGNSPENTNYWQLLAAKGDTPVKGVDYFTQADIASLPMPDLSGYALASDVYSKDDVDDMVAAIESSALKRIIVQELPAVNISSNAIYMIRNLSAEGQNQYDEFMWNENDGSGRWEYIGNTQVDLTGYATESWVNNQGFLTTHQDISGKANSADLATVATTGDYTDLINTPTIPVMPTLANVATSGSYNDLSNKPSIPTKTSDLTNDSGFITSAPVTSVNGQTGAVNISIPTVPTNVSSFTNDAGYLTTHQDISGKQNVLPTGTSGQVLTYNGSAWVANEAPSNVKVYPDAVLPDITITSGPFVSFMNEVYQNIYVNKTYEYIYKVKIGSQYNVYDLAPQFTLFNDGSLAKGALYKVSADSLGQESRLDLSLGIDINTNEVNSVMLSKVFWFYTIPSEVSPQANKVPFWNNGLRNVTVPEMLKIGYSSATSGQILQYDGSDWVAANIPASGGVTYTAGNGISIDANNVISSDPEVEIFSDSWSNYNTPSQDFISFCNDVKQSYDNNENKLYFIKTVAMGLLQVFYIDTTNKEIEVIDAQGKYIIYSVTLTGTDITNLAIKSGYQYFEDHKGYVSNTTTINGQRLNNNIRLTARDVGALADDTAIPKLPNAADYDDRVYVLEQASDGIDSSSWVPLADYVNADIIEVEDEPGVYNSYLYLGEKTVQIGDGLVLECPDSENDPDTFELSASGGGATYTAGNGIDIDANNVISFDLSDRLWAGTGSYSLCIGNSTSSSPPTATNTTSIAIGYNAKATGAQSIAHGDNSEAKQYDSVALSGGKALDRGSFVVGSGCVAGRGNGYSMSSNPCIALGQTVKVGTTRQVYNGVGIGRSLDVESSDQIVLGHFNVIDNNDKTLFTIANGVDSSNRRNAMIIGNNNNQYNYGDIYINCTDFTTTSSGFTTTNCGGSKVATEAYVDARIPAAPSTDGSYILKCTVASGVPTYTWEAAT